MYYKIYHFLHKSNDFLLSCSSRTPSLMTSNRRVSTNASSTNNSFLHRLENTNNQTTRSTLLNKHLQMQLNELSAKFDANPARRSVLHLRTLHGANLVFLKRDHENNEETVIISSNINSKLSKYVRQRKRIIAMLVTLIAVFYVCLFPLKIWNLILILFGSEPYFIRTIQLRQYWYINILCRVLFYLNSSINPILYNWFSKKFRINFRKFVFIPKFIMNRNY